MPTKAAADSHTHRPPPLRPDWRAPELVEVERVVAPEQKQQKTEPRPADEDGRGVEGLLVEHLDEEQRGDSRGDRKRHRVAVDPGQTGGERCARILPTAAGERVPDGRQEPTAHREVEKQHVEEEGEDEQDVEQPQRAGESGGVQGGKQVRSHRPPPSRAAWELPALPSETRYRLSASTSSSLPTTGGMNG